MIAAFNIFDDLPKKEKKTIYNKSVDAANKLLEVAIFNTIFQLSNIQ